MLEWTQETMGKGGDQWTGWKAFETMLADLQRQDRHEKQEMERLKAAGREKSATYRQYFANRMIYSQMLALYRKYGLLD